MSKKSFATIVGKATIAINDESPARKGDSAREEGD